MFKLVCLVALISVAFAASIGNVDSTTEKREVIPLLKFERENSPDGSFSFSYEGGDQSFREETAHVVDAGTEDEALEVSGSYRYIDPDGNTVEVHYTAGKNGFVPVGTNILEEISAAAKAAADLPEIKEEETKRKGRSNDKENSKVEEHKNADHQAEESKVSEKRVASKEVVEKKTQEPKKDEKTKADKVDQIPVIVVQEGQEANKKTA